MNDIKCKNCEEYRNAWCEKIIDSPYPNILRDCQYFHEKKQQWIPVSERLPKEYGEYLITWTTSQSKRPFIAICEGEISNAYDYEHNRFVFEWFLEDYIKAYPDVNVVAWMSLPEPWKGEKES